MAVNLIEALGAAEEAILDRVTIYVPSRDRDGKPVEFESSVAQILELLSQVGGGATRISPAQGAWLNPDTQLLVIEDVTLVYSYVDGDALVARLPAFRGLLHQIGRALNQGEVVIEVNERFYRFATLTFKEQAMARLVVKDTPKPRLEVAEPRTRRRITPGDIEEGLGAEGIAVVPPVGSPMSAYALRQELFRRLRFDRRATWSVWH